MQTNDAPRKAHRWFVVAYSLNYAVKFFAHKKQITRAGINFPTLVLSRLKSRHTAQKRHNNAIIYLPTYHKLLPL